MARKKKKQVQRSIVLVRNDGLAPTELGVSQVTWVNSSKNMIHLDELEDGSWRLIYTEGVIPDITKIKCLQIKRTGNSEVE